MVQALKKRVRVQAGGMVSVQDASLPEGSEAEVIVLLAETVSDEAQPATSPSPLPDEPPPLPFTEIIGSGKGLFTTPEEADAYIRALRDEWD